MNHNEPCPFCGGETTTKVVDHQFVEAGRPDVILKDITWVDCTQCDELSGPSIPAAVLNKL